MRIAVEESTEWIALYDMMDEVEIAMLEHMTFYTEFLTSTPTISSILVESFCFP